MTQNDTTPMDVFPEDQYVVVESVEITEDELEVLAY